MTDYVQCADCKCIRAEWRLSLEWIPGTLEQRELCPVCQSTKLLTLDKKIERVCTSCEQALCATDDDYCEDCRDGSDEKIFDMEAAALLAKRNPCPRYGSALRNIALGRQLEEA